jgi:hypothetical protein
LLRGVSVKKKVLPMDGEYLVLVAVNEEEAAEDILVEDHPQLGRPIGSSPA